MALGIMLSVIFVLAATLTLLPAVLAQARHAGRQRSRCPGCTRASTAVAALRRLGRAPLAPPVALGVATVAVLARARRAGAVAATPACRRSRSCPRTTPAARATRSSSRRSDPAPPARCRSPRPAADADARPRDARRRPGDRPGHRAPGRGVRRRRRCCRPSRTPTRPPRQLGAAIDRLRAALPAGTLVGGAAAENHDLETELADKTPLVIGVVLASGSCCCSSRCRPR